MAIEKLEMHLRALNFISRGKPTTHQKAPSEEGIQNDKNMLDSILFNL